MEAIGIDPRRHDIRFVEDNWESPALGAWGLGWEVWLDGQEITQFTYFQQAGGLTLDPVSVEITYGLDRIALALQGVDSVWEMAYGSGISYENVLLQSEIEHCRYYFDVADVDSIRQIYDTYEREAKRCIEARLVIPAHDYNLKCSHLFNILDTRGAVGVTERANYFRRMRGLARQVSELYVAQREELGFPLRNGDREPVVAINRPQLVEPNVSDAPQTFVLEIGSEELPVSDLDAALKQLATAVPTLLKNARLSYDRIDIDGTPRRLVVQVHALAGRQPDLESVAKGPPADRAFDADGKPTQAAIGFARGKGVDVADLQIVQEGDKRYISAVVREDGQFRHHRLSRTTCPTSSPGSSLSAPCAGTRPTSATAARCAGLWPCLARISCLLPMPGSTADASAEGCRPYDSPEIVVEEARGYGGLMRTNSIVISQDKRREQITAVSQKLAAEMSGTIPDDPALLDEVTNLVEKPTPLRGRFSKRFLALPAEVLVAVMRKHQRYFPVYDANNQLLPYFIAVRNGDENILRFCGQRQRASRAQSALLPTPKVFLRQRQSAPAGRFSARAGHAHLPGQTGLHAGQSAPPGKTHAHHCQHAGFE